jgi:hypothetical protein
VAQLVTAGNRVLAALCHTSILVLVSRRHPAISLHLQLVFTFTFMLF